VKKAVLLDGSSEEVKGGPGSGFIVHQKKGAKYSDWRRCVTVRPRDRTMQRSCKFSFILRGGGKRGIQNQGRMVLESLEVERQKSFRFLKGCAQVGGFARGGGAQDLLRRNY